MFSYDWNFDRILAFFRCLRRRRCPDFVAVVGYYYLRNDSRRRVGYSSGAWRRDRNSHPAHFLCASGVAAASTRPVRLLLLYSGRNRDSRLAASQFSCFQVGFNIAAFIADITRWALSNTSAEYIELGRAMGFSEREMLQRIVAPVAFREMVAPLSYLYVETIKVTYLASVISVHETVYIAQSVITESSRSLEVWVIVAAIYIVCVLPLMAAARLLERHAKLSVGLPAL